MKHLITATLTAIARRLRLQALYNDGGTHENGRLTLQCDAELSSANLLLKRGSDSDHVAVTTAATEKPLGLGATGTDAAEDFVGVALLGKGGDTKLAVASAAIAVDAVLVAAAGGKVATISASAGTYYVIGRALSAAAADGDIIEVDDCHPYAFVEAG